MVHKLVTIRDTVRVPPNRLGEPLEDVILEILRSTYEGVMDKDLGIVLAIPRVREIGQGRMMMGDGGVYHNVVFDALVYKPEINEVVLGEVVELTEFAAFVRIGPLDGLLHVSQVMDDFVSYDKDKKVFQGKQTKRTLKVGDKVRARIISVSMKGRSRAKLGLTMRQPGLGKLEWIEEDMK